MSRSFNCTYGGSQVKITNCDDGHKILSITNNSRKSLLWRIAEVFVGSTPDVELILTNEEFKKLV